MKSFRLFAAILFVGLFLSPSAKAVTVDIPGILSGGDSGVLSSIVSGGGITNYDYVVTGVLDTQTKIIFTLTVSTANIGNIISETAQNRFATVAGSLPADRSAAAALMALQAFSPATTVVDVINNKITSTLAIANSTDAYRAFAAEIQAIVNLADRCRLYSLATLSYEVISTPLPPALLLFGSGIVAVAGFASRKKARK